MIAVGGLHADGGYAALVVLDMGLATVGGGVGIVILAITPDRLTQAAGRSAAAVTVAGMPTGPAGLITRPFVKYLPDAR